MLLVGAGQKSIADILNNAGFDTFPMEVDLADRISIQFMIDKGQEYGGMAVLVNTAGVSPS
ncbi:MAG: hypothetical protein KHY89_01265 [Butyricicoccus pullicaecorum]|nr:hypothetical protein [Butyricicoccus pullicaecorum]